MKLRLPHKFQAALMAALASVSFTTLSTGTLTVAAGAALLAGQQAQADEPVKTALELTVPSGQQLLSGNSGLNWTTSSTTGALSSWEVAFTLTTSTNKEFFNLNASNNAATGYHLTLEDGNTITLRDNSGQLVTSVGGFTSGAAITLSFRKDVNDSGTALGTGTFYLTVAGTGAEAAVSNIATSGANDTTFHTGSSNNGATRFWTTSGALKFTNIQLYQLNDNIIVSSDFTWNGTEEDHDWSHAVWNGTSNFAENGNAMFGTDGYEVVTLSGTQKAGDITISDKAYTFEGSGTLTVSGTVTVNSGAGLVLNSASAAQAMLPKLAGEGNVTLNAVLALGSGFAPTGTGELTINSTRGSGAYDLRLQGGNSATHDFSTFSKLNLAEGVVIEYDAGQTTLNNVTLQGNASFNIFDMGVSGNGIWLKGATALGSHTLAFNNTSGQSWKRKVTIEQLTGDATSRLEFLGGATGDGVGSKLYINSLQGFSGTLELKENNSGNPTQATVYGGTGGDVSLTALEMLGGSEATFRARENGSSTSGYTIGTVTMDAGAKLLTHYSNWNSSNYASVNMSIGRLVMNGDTATVGTTNHGGLVNIGSIQGSGTLTLTYESSSDVKTVFNLGGADVAETIFSGTLDVYHNSGGSKRNTTLILNDEFTAANAVVQFRAVDAGNNARALGIGINAATVKVAGLNDGSIGTTTGTNLYSLFSGSYTELANQYNGGTDFYDNAGDGEVRTMEITGTGNYSTGIKVLGNVNLTMSGTGTQTFSGDVSRFNGSITTTAGTLAITNAITATELNGTGGTLQANGGLTVSGGSYAGTINTPTLTVNEGTLTLTGGGIAGATTVSDSGTLVLNAQDTASVTLAHTITNAGTITLAGNATAGDPANYAVFKTGENTYSGQGAYAGSGYITGSSTQLYLIQHSGSGTFSGELTLTNADRITDGVDANDFVFQLKSGEPIDDVYHVNTAVAYSAEEMGSAGTILLHGPAGTLSLADNTAGALLGSKITGDGNVRISESFQLNGGSSGSVFTTSATGTLTVASGKTLTLGNSKDNAYLDFSSFTGVVLENNAQITLNQRPGMTFQNLSVAAGANAKFIGSDTYNELQNAGHLTGTTTINGSLIMSSGWKYQFTIDKLVGDGTLELQGNYEKHHLIIGGTEGTFGTVKWNAGGTSTEVKFTGNSTVTNLQNANNNGSADLTVNSGVTLDLLGNATNVNVVNNSGTISLHDGSTFTVFAKSGGQAEAMGNISVAGSATIVDTNFHATMNFTTITGGADATLTLLSSHSAQTSEWNLGVSGQTQASPFTGKLVLMAERDGTSNRAANFNFVDGTMFSGAEVQIKNGTEAGNTLTNTLKLKAASVTIGGLSDAAAGTVASDRIWSVANDSGQDYATLTLNGTGTYASDIKLGAGVNLSVTGHGSQTFSGDMSAFNGTLVISDSTLKFTNAGGITATALTATNGTLDVAGTLTLNTDSPFNAFDGGSLALGGLVKTGTGGLAISGITRLGSTIQVNGGSLNVMDGTYELSGLTPTGGGTPVIPTEESGYADVSATVQFITTGEGGSFTKAESGLVFNYKGNTSNTLNENGTVVFEGKDYTTYYLVGTEGNLDLTAEQTAHSMLQNVVLNGTAGTITVTDERSLTGSLTQADGSTLTVAGGGSLTVGSISNNAAVSIAANTSLTSTQAEMIVGAGKTFTTSGEGTLHMTGKTLHVNGNSAVATIGSDADLYQIRMGSGTVNLNGDVTMERLQLSVDNAASTVNIGAGATVHVTGTVLDDHTDNASFMVSNWNQLNTLNIEGHLITEASFSSRDGRADINVKDGGILEMHTGLDRNTTRGHDINVNVAGGGTLLTAGNSADRSEYGLHVNLADGSTLQGYYGTGNAITIAQALTLSGSSNTAKIEAADGKTLTVSGGISGNAGFTKTGTGTLVLSGNNTYTGGTVVDAGTLKAASANALGAGTLTLNAGSTLAVESGASANVLDVTVAGSATISNAGTLVFTGKGGINVAANATITMSGAGTYDLSAMDMEAGTGTVVYTGGAPDTTLNGFAKAAGTIDFVDITAEGSSISYDDGATFLYKGANGTFNSSTGKVEVQAQDYDYTIFYVNEKADYVSNAKKSDVLNRIELASNVTLHVDGNNTIDVSLVQPQAGATGYTIDVNSGGTLNITKTTDTSVITGEGIVHVAIDSETQNYRPTFNPDAHFTGTLVFDEATSISNHNSYVVLDNTFQGTLELRGRMNGHAMNLGGATTLRLVGDRSDNGTGLWSQGAAMTFAQNLEVTGDNQVELWSDGGTIINGTVNSGTNKAGHLTKRENGTMTFNGTVALAEFTNPGGTVNFNAGANIGTVNANGTINLNGAQAAYDLGDFKVAAHASNVQLNVGAVASATAKSIFVGDAANLNLTLSQDMTVAAPSGSTTATDGAFYTMGANKTSNIKTADGVATKTLTVDKLDLANTGTGISLQNVNMVVNGEATVGVLMTDRGSDNATITVGQGATLTLGGGVKWNSTDSHSRTDKVALVVNNGGTVNVNAGDDNTLDAVTLNNGTVNFADDTVTDIKGALSVTGGVGTLAGAGTVKVAGAVANSGILKLDGITLTGGEDTVIAGNMEIHGGTLAGIMTQGADGVDSTIRVTDVFTVASGASLHIYGTMVLDDLAVSDITYTDGEQDADNNGFISSVSVKVYESEELEPDVIIEKSVTYKGTSGLMYGGVFTSHNVNHTTFVVNSVTDTLETYSHAKTAGGEDFTKVELAAGTGFNMDSADAHLAQVTVHEGDSAASLAIGSTASIDAVATGAGLTLTGEDGTLSLASLSGAGALTINGPAVTITGDNRAYEGDIIVSSLLKVGNNYSLGSQDANAHTIRVLSTGTLDVNGLEGTDSGYTVVLEGGTLTNGGTAMNQSKRQYITHTTLAADSTVDTANEFGITGGGYAATSIDLGAYTLEKKGTGTFDIQNAAITGTGKIKVTEGTLAMSTGTGAGAGSFSANFELAGGTVTGTLNLAGSTVITTTAASTFSASVNTNGHGITFAGNLDQAVTGTITGNGHITKTGIGTLTLSGANTYPGGFTVAAGATIVVIRDHIADAGTLTADGDGVLRLVTGQDGNGQGIRPVTAKNLELGDNANNNSRFFYGAASNLNGVQNLYFDGAQLWLSAMDMTGGNAFKGAVTFGTTTYKEGGNAFEGAAIRVEKNGNFAGTVNVQENTKFTWGANQTLELSGTVSGFGNLNLASYNNNTGTFKISGDASNYQGATTSNSHITVHVTESGKMNLATDSNLAGTVQLDAGGKMTVSGDSTITGAINGTGSLEVKENATLNYNRTAETTVAAQLSGEGTLQYTGTGTTKFTGDVSGFSGSVDVQAGELNIMNIAQATSLNVADVTIKNATLGVYSGATATAETASEGTLTIKNGSTLTASGENAKLNANLVMESGSTLDVSAYGGMGGLHMGSTITLTPGMTLSDNDMAGVSNLGFMDAYDLYFDVNEFFVGSTQYEEITFASEQWVKAADVFSNSEFASGKDYYVFYSGVNPGGNGGNVGTIYIVQVPEPTTGTLSLLALCALAARRRRKA